MIKAVAETCGRSVEAIKAQLEQEGDLGVVALSSRGKQVTLSKPKPLTAKGVLGVFREIAQASQARRSAVEKSFAAPRRTAQEHREFSR